jgi:uncharacterized membrane protein
VSGGYADRQGRQHGFVWQNGRFIVFDAPGNRTETDGWGINNRGAVVVPDPEVGGLDNVSAPIEPLAPGPLAGFVLDDGRYRKIEVPGATQTLAFGIDDRDRIAGGYEDADGRVHGFVRDEDGDIRTIDVPGAYATIATRINDRGQVVGDYFETQQKTEQGLKRGFMLDRGRFIRIDAPGAESSEVVGVDDRGRAVGETIDLDTNSVRGRHGPRRYLWDDGRFRLIDPGMAGGAAAEINERGQIAGIYAGVLVSPLVAESTGGYLLDRGRYTRFAAPGGPFTQVFGLNNHEEIVGYTADAPFRDIHGFLRGDDGEYTAIEVPFGFNTMALGINDAGQIVGTYEKPTTSSALSRAQASAGDHLLSVATALRQR